MTRPPALAKAFRGRWRIIEMEVWPDDYLDLIEPAHIAFEGRTDGVFVFGAVKGWLDVRYGARDGAACAEFSWEGNNDADSASGRGGPPSAPRAASSAISSSTTATTRPLSPSMSDSSTNCQMLDERSSALP